MSILIWIFQSLIISFSLKTIFFVLIRRLLGLKEIFLRYFFPFNVTSLKLFNLKIKKEKGSFVAQNKRKSGWVCQSDIGKRKKSSFEFRTRTRNLKLDFFELGTRHSKLDSFEFERWHSNAKTRFFYFIT